MKNSTSKKTIWQSTLSVIILLHFVVFGIGSTSLFGLLGVPLRTESEYDEKTDQYTDYVYGYKGENMDTTWRHIVRSRKDSYGNRQGETKIYNSNNHYDAINGIYYTRRSEEIVFMQNGKRDGKSITYYNSYYEYDDDLKEYGKRGRSDTVCYDYGNVIPCNQLKNDLKGGEKTSAYSILNNNYPWFLGTLEVMDFSDEYVEAYMDTVELLLSELEFSAKDFNNEYDDVVELLEETSYDSIILINNMLTSAFGVETLKDFEFRYAVIDQQRNGKTGTFKIIQQQYPNLLEALNDKGLDAEEQEFEVFCHQFDSIIATYNPLVNNDPYFSDSVDVRINSALLVIYSTEESELKIQSLKASPAQMLNQLNLTMKSDTNDRTPKQIAQFMMSLLLSKFLFNGDIPRQAFLQAYNVQQQIVQLPILTTSLIEKTSSVQIIIGGNIIKDGGGVITERGVVWSKAYNPALEDNKIIISNLAKPFVATIADLTEGETYFVRAYAINETGISYGNNIEFVAQNIVGIEENQLSINNLRLYPNPASNKVMIETGINQAVELQILNIEGKQRIQIKEFSSGEVDISSLVKGIYIIRITNNNTAVTKKLIVK